MVETKQAARLAVGADLASVLPSNKKPWYRTSHLLHLNLLLGSCLCFSSTIGYDNSLLNSLQAFTPWATFMHHPAGSYLGLIGSMYSLGSCFSYPVMSFVVQKYGRKMSIYCGCVLLVLGSGLQAGSSTRAMFIVSRLLVGASTGFFGAIPMLVAETAYPTHRAIITSLYLPLYYIGTLLAAWLCYGIRDMQTNTVWRIPSAIQVAIPALVFVPMLFTPESPRWQVANGQMAKARATLVKYHAGGDETSPLVAFEMTEIEETFRIEQELSKEASYLDLFKTKGNRHRLFIGVTLGIFAQWNGVGIISYYLVPVLETVGVTSVTDQTLINGCLGVWNLIVAVGSATLVDKLGRRFLFLTSSVGMLICYIIVTGLSGSYAKDQSKGVGLAVIPMLYLFYAFYNVAFCPLIGSYPVEIFPYRLRSRGVVVTQGATFAALFFNTFVNPIALAALAWKYYLIYVVILVVICVTVYFTYPETRGHSLEEMAVVFDGTDAPVASSELVLETVAISAEEKGHTASAHVEDAYHN